MKEEIYDYLMGFPKPVVAHWLMEALDEMETYNGQSKSSAILRAAGAVESADGTLELGKTRHDRKAIRERFQHPPLIIEG